MKESLSDAQEAEARQLAQALAQTSYDDILAIARTLVATDNASLFGDTEFTVRNRGHAIAAKAYRQHLEQKKRLPGSQRNLSALPGCRRLSWRPPPLPGRSVRRGSLPTRLLLLPTLRPRLFPF